jgi:hypothetical protein
VTSVQETESGNERLISRPWVLVAVAALMGLTVDLLIMRHPVGFGVSAVGALLASGVVLSRTFFGFHTTREAFVLALALGFWSILISLRSVPSLAFLNTVTAVLLLGLTFRLLKSGGLLRWTITGYIWSGFATLGGWVLQPFEFFSTDFTGRWLKQTLLGRAGRVLIGALLAVPLLGLFAALFASADPVFEEYLNSALSIDVDLASIAGHAATVLVVAWLAMGAARYALVRHHTFPNLVARRILGSIEAATVLILLNSLFVVFVVVQSAYLFGGRETLSRVGLTYSEYARRGFFELVVAGSLVIGLVLVIDWMVQKDPRRARTVDLLHGGLIALTLVILVSALQRMRLYTEAFGLTELRLYTTVFMGWVFVVLGWLVFTILRGRRARFALGAFVSALVVVAGLTIANPAGIIVRTNVERAAAAGKPDLDVAYLVDLGPDAVPSLIANLDQIQPCAPRSELAGLLLREGTEGFEPIGTDWRGTNWSRVRADKAFSAAEADLVAVASEACP